MRINRHEKPASVASGYSPLHHPMSVDLLVAPSLIKYVILSSTLLGRNLEKPILIVSFSTGCYPQLGREQSVGKRRKNAAAERHLYS